MTDARIYKQHLCIDVCALEGFLLSQKCVFLYVYVCECVSDREKIYVMLKVLTLIVHSVTRIAIINMLLKC